MSEEAGKAGASNDQRLRGDAIKGKKGDGQGQAGLCGCGEDTGAWAAVGQACDPTQVSAPSGPGGK